MSSISPYDEALQIIKQYPGTSGASGMAKLVLSLYNHACGYSFGECVASMDSRLTEVAFRMARHYATHGETADLIEAGKIIADDFYPRLWEMGQAMSTARHETRKRWEREELEREALGVEAAEKEFASNPECRSIPPSIAAEMLASDEIATTAYYYSPYQWRTADLALDDVRAAVLEHGTGFLTCNPESSYFLGVILKGRIYYVHPDYDVRERYLDSVRPSK